MPLPVAHDVAHYRGDTLTIVLRLWADADKTVPSDLTGATIRAQVRPTVDAVDTLTEFDVSMDLNTVTLLLLPAETATLPAAAVWDCEVDWTSDGTRVETPVAGKLTIRADVTRA